MEKKIVRVSTEVNGYIYQSEVDRLIESEKAEQIASCKRYIKKMLNEDGLSDVNPEYRIEKYE